MDGFYEITGKAGSFCTARPCKSAKGAFCEYSNAACFDSDYPADKILQCDCCLEEIRETDCNIVDANQIYNIRQNK